MLLSYDVISLIVWR